MSWHAYEKFTIVVPSHRPRWAKLDCQVEGLIWFNQEVGSTSCLKNKAHNVRNVVLRL